MSKQLRTVKQAAIVDRVPQLHARLIDVAADFQTLSDQITGATSSQNPNLIGWALSLSFTVSGATRDVNGALTSANITWPDGATGVFTATVLSTAFPGAIDAWSATYVKGGITATVTQPTVTRDATGAVTNQPAITIT